MKTLSIIILSLLAILAWVIIYRTLRTIKINKDLSEMIDILVLRPRSKEAKEIRDYYNTITNNTHEKSK